MKLLFWLYKNKWVLIPIEISKSRFARWYNTRKIQNLVNNCDGVVELPNYSVAVNTIHIKPRYGIFIKGGNTEHGKAKTGWHFH